MSIFPTNTDNRDTPENRARQKAYARKWVNQEPKFTHFRGVSLDVFDREELFGIIQWLCREKYGIKTADLTRQEQDAVTPGPPNATD